MTEGLHKINHYSYWEEIWGARMCRV